MATIEESVSAIQARTVEVPPESSADDKDERLAEETARNNAVKLNSRVTDLLGEVAGRMGRSVEKSQQI